MRPADYRRLIEEVNAAGATLDVDHGRLLLIGEVDPELRGKLWIYEAEIVSLLERERGVDARTAALELWGWLETGLLAEISDAVVLQPGVTVLPGRIEFAVRGELQMAKGKSHRAKQSRDNLRALHAALRSHVQRSCR